MKVLSHNWTGKSLVVVFRTDSGKAKTRIVSSSHANWKIIDDLYRQAKYEELIPYLDVGGAIQKKLGGKFTVADGKVYYDGTVVHGYLINRILLTMQDMPHETSRLVRFAENLYSNPDKAVINELYKFLEHKHMPITDDGCFLAYKGVKSDYFSITSGDIDPSSATASKAGVERKGDS